MRLKQILLTLCFFMMVNASVIAQDVNSYSPHDYGVIPPSPEVTALMRYIDFPVSPFTGQPDITIPLYTVREGTLEVPVSISYHGGGVKVYEPIGIIGHGWNMNAGGCISRTVRGLPDELNRGGVHGLRGLYHLNNDDKLLRSTIMGRNVDNIYFPMTFLSDYPSDYVLPETLCNDYDDGYCDMANDIFHFSFLGKTGTVIVDPDNQQSRTVNSRVPIKFNSWSIPNDGGSCCATDLSHTQYLFNVQERSKFRYSYLQGGTWMSDSILCGSAWHVSQMSNNRGEQIFFDYLDAGRKSLCRGVGHTSYSIRTTNPSVCDTTYIKHYSHNVEYDAKLLSRIRTRSITVEFIYDLQNDFLDSIKVFRNATPKELVKCFVLNRNSSDDLASINEINHLDGTNLILYQFLYYSEGEGYNDCWGYHGDDKSHLLQQVVYPTGGSTVFEWERNDYSYIGQWKQDEYDSTQTITYITKLWPALPQNQEQLTQANVSSNMFDSQYQLSISQTNSGIRLKIDLSTFMTQLMDSYSGMNTNNSLYHYCHSAGCIPDQDPRVELWSPTNELLGRWFIDSCFCAQAPVWVSMNEFNEVGTYRVSLKYPYNWLLDYYGNNDLTSSAVYNYLIPGGTENSTGDHGYILIERTVPREHQMVYSKPWGGWRIKSIISNPGFYDTISKSYTYKDKYDSSCSSGTVLEEPWFESKSYKAKFELLLPNKTGITYWATIEGMHSDGIYSTPNSESHVEYPYVQEIYPNSGLHVDYTFSSQRDYSINDVKHALFYEFMPGGSRMNTSIDHRTGNLLHKSYYLNGKEYKTEDYTYNIFEGCSPWFCGDFFKITDVREVPATISQNSNVRYSSDYTTCRYKLIPYCKSLATSELNEYSLTDTTQTAFQTVVSYGYFRDSYSESLGATLPKSTTATTSDGKDVTTYFKYVMGQSDPFDLHEVEVTICDGKIVSARRYVYDDNNNLVETYRAPTGLTMNNAYGIGNNDYGATEALKNAINQLEYQYQYDNDNNLVQVSWRGIPLASYLWGYLSTHPIVEIKAVSIGEVTAALPDGLKPAQLVSRYDLTPTILNQIRTALSGFEVTTITYDWLIGMGTMTDPRGTTTTFTHDGYGRLSSVRDWNNYILRKYDYHYQNQN